MQLNTKRKGKINEDIKKEFGFLVINGEYYKEAMLDGKPIFKRVSKKNVEKKIKLIKEIVVKLKEGLDKEAVLTERLMSIENDDEAALELLHGMLYNSKKKYKPKTRRHHCVDMKVGKLIIPIC